MTMPTNFSPKSARLDSRSAFSLVEIAISLGIVGFGLVAVLGTLPAALTSSRQSMAQTRATQLACSVFASFRAQPFSSVCYVDEQFASNGVTPSGSGPSPINLLVAQTPAGMNDDAVSRSPQNTSVNVDNQYIRFFALVDLTDPSNGANDPSRVHFSIQPPASGGFQIILHFNPVPDGVSGTGLANRVDMLVSATDHPTDYYRFTRTVANCSGTLPLSQL